MNSMCRPGNGDYTGRKDLGSENVFKHSFTRYQVTKIIKKKRMGKFETPSIRAIMSFRF